MRPRPSASTWPSACAAAITATAGPSASRPGAVMIRGRRAAALQRLLVIAIGLVGEAAEHGHAAILDEAPAESSAEQQAGEPAGRDAGHPRILAGVVADPVHDAAAPRAVG